MFTVPWLRALEDVLDSLGVVVMASGLLLLGYVWLRDRHRYRMRRLELESVARLQQAGLLRPPGASEVAAPVGALALAPARQQGQTVDLPGSPQYTRSGDAPE
jgi:hypothetical protein